MPRTLDLTGQTYGRLTCIEPVGRNKFGQVVWRCRCSCGHPVERHAAEIRKSRMPSCGCWNREHAQRIGRRNAADLVGQRFGRLVVVERTGRSTGTQQVQWLCRCDCGSETTPRTADLRSGNTTSCGRCPFVRWADQCSYTAIHARLAKARGKAADHSCVRCTGRAHEWAYRGDSLAEVTDPSTGIRYSPHVEDYDPMCIACHRRFDRERKRAAL